MRKIVLTVVASSALVAFVPASALARGHSKRHSHHAHHARVHHKTFGSDPSQPTTTTPGTTSTPQTAGTVASFIGGKLMITLNDGSTVSGMVTPDTEIECQAAQTTEMSGHDSGDNGGGDQGDSNNQGDDDQGQGDDDNANQTCDTTSLATGAMVQEAELSISGAGAVWNKVVLVAPASSTSPSSSGSDDNDD